MPLTEHPPLRPEGHPNRPDHVIVGWEPCLGTPGHTGNRTYWRRGDGMVLLVPGVSAD